MCNLKALGGRCAAHTRPEYEQSVRDLVRAGIDHAPPDVWDTFQRAATNYASTPEGEQQIQRDLARQEQAGRLLVTATLGVALRRGRAQGEAFAEMQAQIQDARETMARSRAGSMLPDTYPQRSAEAQRAQEAFERAREEAKRARRAAPGAFAPGSCTACTHPEHTEQTCTHGTDVGPCGCGRSVAPTVKQKAAYALLEKARAAHGVWQEKLAEASAALPGDRFTVTRGRAVPVGTTGTVLRTFAGKYGPRAYLRTDEGQEVWVTLINLDRLAPVGAANE